LAQLLSLLRKTEAYETYHEYVKETFDLMATEFDNNPDLLTWDTSELVAAYPDTSHEEWRSFLSLDVVQRYIKGVIQFQSGIAFRKAHKALATSAAGGNTTAAKQITEISQILTQEQSNRTVVLTYVQRPRKPVKQEPSGSYVPTAERPDVDDDELYARHTTSSGAIEPTNSEDAGGDPF
jgi:hypothetical protein